MKIFVKAKPRIITIRGKPNSKKEKIEKISETEYIVAVKEPPVKGRANEAIKKALAEYFSVSLSRIRISAGHASKNKIVEMI